MLRAAISVWVLWGTRLVESVQDTRSFREGISRNPRATRSSRETASVVSSYGRC